MEHNISYDPGEKIITITIAGRATLPDVPPMLTLLAEQINRTSCNKVLVDVRQTVINMTLMDLITLPGMIQSTAREHQIEVTSIRRAMVAQKNPSMMEMYEILVHYIGGSFKSFTSIEAAETWLQEPW